MKTIIREIIALIICGMLLILVGISIINKSTLNDTKEKNEKRVSDSTDRVNNFNDSIESSQIHEIQPQEINGNLYYLSRLGLTGWDVNILDPLSTNIIPLKVYEYRIQIDSNFKTPHIKGVTNNGRHFGPMVILYDKKRIPIFVAQYK